MAVRDRVVLWALGSGAALAILCWLFVGPWVALATVLIALGVAATAYRIEAPRIDVEHPEAWEARASRSPEAARAETIDR